MIPIYIDTKALFEGLSITDEQCNAFVDNVVKDITYGYFVQLNKEAESALDSTRNRYIRNIRLVDSGKMSGTVILDYSKDKLVRMVEEGVSPFDMKCIVNANTRIYTSKGWVKIKDIKIGDLVLTHLGKFQRVSQLFKEKNEDEFIYKIKTKVKENRQGFTTDLNVTSNHPILTNLGWIKAENLDNKIHKIIVSANKCNFCKKIIPTINLEDNSKQYCNKSCAAKENNKFRKEFGRIDLTEKGRKSISESFTNINLKAIENGTHVTQTGKLQEWTKNNCSWGFESISNERLKEIQHLSSISRGKNHNFSDPESKLYEKIKHLKGIERQHIFIRDEMVLHSRSKTKMRNRRYSFDFAFPEHKICIEVNGERFHTKEQDENKKIEVEAKGWRYLSFWSKEIYANIDNCVKEIERVLMNHNEEYNFTEVDFKIEKIKRKKLATMYNYKYNFTVENDSSYIANGIVTHNSGFLDSSKVKTGKNGNRYLTIPFRLSNPNAVADSSIFAGKLPNAVYVEVKNKPSTIYVSGGGTRSAGLKASEIPEPYDNKLTRPTIFDDSGNVLFDEYVHKSSIYEGVFKQTDNVTGQNTYHSFRRVSENSDKLAWIHKGIVAKGLMEVAFSNFNIQSEIGVSIDNRFKSLF